MLHIEIIIIFCSSYGIPFTLGIMNSYIETRTKKRNKIIGKKKTRDCDV